MTSLTVRSFTGQGIEPYLDDLARLRIAVFRDWPHLYDGDYRYEFAYLQTYLRSPVSIAVLAFDGEQVVGAATGLPLASEAPAFLASLSASSLALEEVFYFGESMLLANWRGRGLGHRFFDAREAHARALGDYAWTAFGAVAREDGDPRRPPFQRSHEAFWRKRGYRPRDGLLAGRSWRERGQGEVPHTLSVWLRPLERL